MRKSALLCILVLLLAFLSGCGSSQNITAASRNDGGSSVTNVLRDQIEKSSTHDGNTLQIRESEDKTQTEEQIQTEETVIRAQTEEIEEQVPADETAETNLPENASETAESDETVDVDLTVLSANMVYSEVYDMVFSPENYIGKTVKMRGQFTVFTDQETLVPYYTCLIADATACCAQGIEFELIDRYRYPEDYPVEGSEITVIGTFDTYTEGHFRYCTLRNAVLE